MGAYLSAQNMSKRTKVEGLRNVEGQRETINYWIDLAESLLNTANIDSSTTGFANIAAYITQNITEFLFLQNEEQIVVANNTPFISERLGSYSYRKFPRDENQKRALFADLPMMVQIAIQRITKYNIPLSIVSNVFREEGSDVVTGIREYNDLLDIEIARIADSDGVFEIGNR